MFSRKPKAAIVRAELTSTRTEAIDTSLDYVHRATVAN